MAFDQLIPENRQRFIDRLNAIGPDRPRRWGEFTPTQLMAHLRRMFEISLEEVVPPDESNILTRTVIRWLAFHVMPSWPKGKLKGPACTRPESGEDFEAEQSHCLAALDRFLEAQTKEPTRRTRSPLFGNLTLRYWGHLHGKHMEHHFKQFGV